MLILLDKNVVWLTYVYFYHTIKGIKAWFFESESMLYGRKSGMFCSVSGPLLHRKRQSNIF